MCLKYVFSDIEISIIIIEIIKIYVKFKETEYKLILF